MGDLASLKNDAQHTIHEPSRSNRSIRGRKLRRYIFSLVFFSMPSVATFCGWTMYRGIRRLCHVPRSVLLVLFIADLCVIAMQPVSAIASGPFYLWYVVMNHVVFQLSRGMALGKFLMLHQSYNLLGSATPFLSSRQVFGTPANLFFTFPEAVTSSVVWTVGYVSVRGLFYRPTHHASKVARGVDPSSMDDSYVQAHE